MINIGMHFLICVKIAGQNSMLGGMQAGRESFGPSVLNGQTLPAVGIHLNQVILAM
jgi:hypothetical protein